MNIEIDYEMIFDMLEDPDFQELSVEELIQIAEYSME